MYTCIYIHTHTHTQCSEFPPKHCFHCIPQILISCIFILFKIFFFNFCLRFLLWPTCYLEVLFVCLFFNLQVFGDSPTLSIIDFYFNSIVVWEKTYIFYSFKFLKVCFMAQNVVFLGEWTIWAWEECVFCCCCIKWSIDVDYIQLIDGALEFNYVVTDFLPAGSVHFW